MPNGGSDCCGTCWFNARNKGEAGYSHAKDPEPAHCTIRDLPIENPFYTYCANHPHRRPQRDSIPIGPVFTATHDEGREVWRPSPDSENIRRHLLRLLAEIGQEPVAEYPLGIYSEEVVVRQLGEFRERRAVDDLRRIISFDPTVVGSGSFPRSREDLVQPAHEALAKITVELRSP